MMSRQRALVFPPGERYQYSNSGYMLLAQVLERAAGKSLGELARERIFEPLGMEGSLMYENREEIIPHRATGYHRDDDGRLRIVHNYNFEIAGDGQLYTTVEDLLRWDDYLHGAETPSIHGEMLTEGTLNNGDPIGYAQGVVPGEYRGLRTVGHGGHSWGFRTELVRFVEPGLSIAIACNAEFAEPGDLGRRVADHYLADRLGPPERPDEDEEEETDDDQEDAEAPSASLAPSLSSVELAEFDGSFFSAELDATYRFAVVDGDLTLRIEQEPSLDVTPRWTNPTSSPSWPGPIPSSAATAGLQVPIHADSARLPGFSGTTFVTATSSASKRASGRCPHSPPSTLGSPNAARSRRVTTPIWCCSTPRRSRSNRRTRTRMCLPWGSRRSGSMGNSCSMAARPRAAGPAGRFVGPVPESGR